LEDGDVVIIWKNSYYDTRLPDYYDLLCFKRSFVPKSARTQDEAGEAFDEKSYRFAAAVGLPGDELEIRGDEVYRDGAMANPSVASSEKSESASTSDVSAADAGRSATTRKVAPGEVFVMNDNPEDKLDSRDERVNVRLDDVRGRVVFRVWPLNRFGIVK
jgi:signal peptidase I